MDERYGVNPATGEVVPLDPVHQHAARAVAAGSANATPFPSHHLGAVSLQDLSDLSDGEAPLAGSRDQLTLDVGGDEPTRSSVSLRGGKLTVDGEFDKGETIKVVVEARVSEVAFVDLTDKEGYPVGTERRHVAKVTSARHVEQGSSE